RQSIDTRPTAGESAESRLHAFGNRVFFFGRDPEHGLELWSSDGTDEGTRLVKDLYPGPGSIHLQAAPHTAFIEHRNQLYFCVSSAFPVVGADVHGIWRTDGTEAGTVRVWSGKVHEWTKYGGFLFVSGDQGRSRGLWRIAEIPEEIVPVHLRSVDAPGYSPEFLAGFRDRLFFVANSDSHGRELWRTDSTFTNVVEVKNFQADSPGPVQTSSFVAGIFPTGDTCFVLARSRESGLELWKTDGTEAGTVLVKDINPGVRDGFEPGFLNFANLGGRLYFGAVSDKPVALWMSDGTESGTRVVHAGTGRVRSLEAIGDRLYFSGGDRSVGTEELWISDGTEPGTFMLANINPDRPPVFAWGSSPEGFEAAGGSVYFKAGDNRFGAELWRTDGTTEGTVRVADVNPVEAPPLPPPYTTSFRGSSYPWSLARAGTNLFFVADDGTHGRELWVLPLSGMRPPRLDGFATDSGAFRVRITASPGSSFRLFRTSDWSGAWVEAGAGRVPDSGTVEVRDDNPPASAAFYRVTTSNP
ncbi:MAG: hypothetical protein JNL97_09110, partial [Verrucomicrobiales bacterium]|nr:hypothetical protein [Verrucomicrobiales bacterium]